MNELERRLKRTLEQAGAKARMRPNVIEEDVEAAFAELSDGDEMPILAAKVLFRLCTDGGCATNRKFYI